MSCFVKWSDFLCSEDLFVKGFAKFILDSILPLTMRKMNAPAYKEINYQFTLLFNS